MNRPIHQLVAAAASGLYLVNRENEHGDATLKPFAGAAATALFTNLPDILEPATSPNHRSFFHSIAFAALIGKCLHDLSQWQPVTDEEKFWRGIGMLAASGYLIHLALDFTTAKSLPLIS